jgi:CBS domain containing-hemolysin-like protein
MHDICKKAGAQHVRDFMHVPSDGETIDVEATLDHAIHQLIVGGYQSLLVRRKADIIGILRLTDVFATITASIKACAL